MTRENILFVLILYFIYENSFRYFSFKNKICFIFFISWRAKLHAFSYSILAVARFYRFLFFSWAFLFPFNPRNNFCPHQHHGFDGCPRVATDPIFIVISFIVKDKDSFYFGWGYSEAWKVLTVVWRRNVSGYLAWIFFKTKCDECP